MGIDWGDGMTAIAATTGTYRSRVDGTLVIQIEIQPADRVAALELLGMPGTQVAIAALRDGSRLEQKPGIRHRAEL